VAPSEASLIGIPESFCTGEPAPPTYSTNNDVEALDGSTIAQTLPNLSVVSAVTRSFVPFVAMASVNVCACAVRPNAQPAMVNKTREKTFVKTLFIIF